MMDNIEIITGIIDAEVRDTLTNIAETPLPEEAAESEEAEEAEDEQEG